MVWFIDNCSSDTVYVLNFSGFFLVYEHRFISVTAFFIVQQWRLAKSFMFV